MYALLQVPIKMVFLNHGDYELVIYGDNLNKGEVAANTIMRMHMQEGESGVQRKIYYL